MSIKLDPKEVLKYLNDLGYCNISALQLKEFMRDLKVLIKYDQKKNPENKENLSKNASEYVNLFLTNSSAQTNFRTRSENINISKKSAANVKSTQVYSNLHSASTTSSRAKSVQKDDMPSCSKSKQSNCSLGNDRISRTETRIYPSACTLSNMTDGYTDDYSVNSDTEMSYRPTERAKSASTALELKPKVSFIRPRKPISSTKSDPVALYHKYQATWKKQKLPGEDKHNNLRWAIRERMLGQPIIKPFAAISNVNTLSKKQNNRL